MLRVLQGAGHLSLPCHWAVCAGKILKIMRAEMVVGATEVRRLGSSGN